VYRMPKLTSAARAWREFNTEKRFVSYQLSTTGSGRASVSN